MPTDDELRTAAEAVRSAAAAYTPPQAADLRQRQGRRARGGLVVSALAVLMLVTIGAFASTRPSGEQDLAAGDGRAGSGGTVGTQTPGTRPGSVPPRTTATSAPMAPACCAPIDPAWPTTAPGPTAPPSTATPTTEFPVDPAPTSIPDAWSVTLTGSYAGLEHYALFTGRCPDIHHRLEADWTAGEPAWSMVADYCGTNGADGIWRGKGTFTLSGPDGTLHGDFENEAPIGTSGVPYTVRLAGGTGRYADVAGDCAVSVSVREIRFGEQAQTGIITCVLRRP